MANILLGVSGGIAAYKALELVRLATAAGHSVRVIQTPAAQRFVGAASFEALTGAPVLVGEDERDPGRGAFPGEPLPAHDPISHLEMVGKAELYLVAPATANTIAKLAHGLADNLLCGAALAARCPLLVAPAMNDRMYEHAATRANIETLRRRGVQILEPDAGRLASAGEWGPGRLQEPAEILAACEAALAAGTRRSPLHGVKVLVTAGGTREPIDSVRFLGNSSSGRMGLALAEAALARGARVSVIAANVDLPRPAGAEWIEAPTAEQLQRACEEALPSCDVLLMAAAVADFRPAQPQRGKIKKGSAPDGMALRLEPTVDVIAKLAQMRAPGQLLVGFAAEHGADAAAAASAKLEQKGLDALVVNDVSRADVGFESAENEVSILADGIREHVAKAPKREVAERILDVVQRLRADGGGRSRG